MPTKKVAFIFALAMGLGAFSCVIRTEHKIEAHVTLDIRFVEDQADDMYDFLSGDTDLADLETESVDQEHSSLRRNSLKASLLARVFDLASTARAASSQKITEKQKEILIRMKARFATLQKYKGLSCIGEKKDAYVIYRPCDACKEDAELKAKVGKTVKDESADRKALYLEIAKAGGGGAGDVPKIQAVWAEKFRKEAKRRHWIQAPTNAAALAKFKKTPNGAKLGDVKPGQWYKLP